MQVTQAGGGSLPFRKKLLFIALACVVLGGLFACIAELVLRAAGFRPWNPQKIAVRVEPGGKLFAPHPTLGYRQIPGAFRVTLRDGYEFRVTHLPSTRRVTHPLEAYSPIGGRPEIWIFGCSFTYGWSLNDEETYPYLIQQAFPAFEVANFGTNGYGTLHSLLQFREALETRKPQVAILAYARFHDERNTFLRIRQKSVAPWNQLGPVTQPYATLDSKGELRIAMAEVEYREFPLMRRSALSHFIEMKVNDFEASRAHSDRVTQALIDQMAGAARAQGIRFVVATIAGGLPMLEFARSRGIPTVDISVDLSLPEHNNNPHDFHPSARANRTYAAKLEDFLRKDFDTRRAEP